MPTVKLEERAGSKMVCVRFDGPLTPEDERWFLEYLHKSSGVAYMEMDKDTRRLMGYGVWEPWWEQFRFWLGVSMLGGAEG